MEIGVIGAGIVGLAVARALTRRGAQVTVIDKEPEVGRHQTGHNSGVVHAGLYYRPGSLKAELCARGRGMLREYCADRGIAFDEIGKIVVAVDDAERAGLADICERSLANQVPGLRRLTAAEIREIEPAARGVAALYSPHTAVVDFPAVARAVADDIVQGGGLVLLGAEVRGIRRERGRVAVLLRHSPHDASHGAGHSGAGGAGSGSWAGGAGADASGAEVRTFDTVVICAGLQVDRLAVAAGDDADPRIVPFLGMYYAIRPERRDLVRGLIYPVPDPRFPFLGVHLTRTAGGEVLVGPNAVLGLARERYRALGADPRDMAATLSWPGFYRMAGKYWRAGAHELAGAASTRRFIGAARRYVPELEPADVVRAQVGVRAQAVTRGGELVDDFVIRDFGDVIAVRNAPSPAATSSFAIAEYLVPHILRGR